MRDRFPWVVLGGLVLTALLGLLLVRSAQRGTYAEVHSTYRSREGGSRALYLLALEQGLPVERRTSELLELEQGTSLVFLGASFPAAPEQWEITRGTGGPSLPAPVPPVPSQGAASPPDALDVMGDEETLGAAPPSSASTPVTGQELFALLNHIRNGHLVVHAPSRPHPDAFTEQLGVSLSSDVPSSAARLLVPSTPHPWTRGFAELHAPVSAFIEALPPDAIPLIEDALTSRTVAAWVPYGEGGVLVLTAPALFDNQHLARLANADFALRLLNSLAEAGGRVQFDEYHHGFQSARSLVRFGARYGLHWALLQLLLGLVVWTFSLQRFGPPRPPEEEVRNTRVELLSASARLYREGGHAGWCASQLARWLTRSLARHAGVRAHAEPDEVISGLERRGLTGLAGGLREVLALAATTTHPHHLLKTARATSRTFRRIRPVPRPHPNDASQKRDAA